MKLHKLALYLSAASLAAPVVAQDAGIADADDKVAESSGEAIIVTGSRIKRDPNNSPLPLTVITPDDITR